MTWLLIALGGALGALARHATSVSLTARTAGWTGFPIGTFVVNLVGCFAAGVVLGALARSLLPVQLRGFLMVGVLGGFTTFSAFGVETFLLVQKGEIAIAVSYAVASVLVAVVAVWVGWSVFSLLP